MSNAWRKLVGLGMLGAAAACAEVTAPPNAGTDAIPARLIVPGLSQESAMKVAPSRHYIDGSAVGGDDGSGDPPPPPPDGGSGGSGTLIVPPEYQGGALYTAFTSVEFAAGPQIKGHGEMAFYGTEAEEVMTVWADKDGTKVGSQTFPKASISFVIPMGWDLPTDGSISAPSCGSVAQAVTSHSVSVIYVDKDLARHNVFGASGSSQAAPAYQSGCPGSAGSGSGGGGGGYILKICTTTTYYSASGEKLYTTTSCREEVHAI